MESDRGCRITVLHSGQEQQCSHCLRRADSCPGAGMGKICVEKQTPKGMISDYMKHLKLHHNYTSLKMKFQQEEYPLLSAPRKLGDGFGHMVENDTAEDEIDLPNNDQNIDLAQSNARIVELESQLSDQNLLKQQLTETKARLAANTKTFDVPQHFFEYIAESDEVKTVNEPEFEKFVDGKCKVGKDRDMKKAELKHKVLDHVRQVERRRRGLSISSAASIAWSDSSSRVRPRSVESDGGGGDPKQSRISLSQSAL